MHPKRRDFPLQFGSFELAHGSAGSVGLCPRGQLVFQRGFCAKRLSLCAPGKTIQKPLWTNPDYSLPYEHCFNLAEDSVVKYTDLAGALHELPLLFYQQYEAVSEFVNNDHNWVQSTRDGYIVHVGGNGGNVLVLRHEADPSWHEDILKTTLPLSSLAIEDYHGAKVLSAVTGTQMYLVSFLESGEVRKMGKHHCESGIASVSLNPHIIGEAVVVSLSGRVEITDCGREMSCYQVCEIDEESVTMSLDLENRGGVDKRKKSRIPSSFLESPFTALVGLSRALHHIDTRTSGYTSFCRLAEGHFMSLRRHPSHCYQFSALTSVGSVLFYDSRQYRRPLLEKNMNFSLSAASELEAFDFGSQTEVLVGFQSPALPVYFSCGSVSECQPFTLRQEPQALCTRGFFHGITTGNVFSDESISAKNLRGLTAAPTSAGTIAVWQIFDDGELVRHEYERVDPNSSRLEEDRDMVVKSETAETLGSETGVGGIQLADWSSFAAYLNEDIKPHCPRWERSVCGKALHSLSSEALPKLVAFLDCFNSPLGAALNKYEKIVKRLSVDEMKVVDRTKRGFHDPLPTSCMKYDVLSHLRNLAESPNLRWLDIKGWFGHGHVENGDLSINPSLDFWLSIRLGNLHWRNPISAILGEKPIGTSALVALCWKYAEQGVELPISEALGRLLGPVLRRSLMFGVNTDIPPALSQDGREKSGPGSPYFDRKLGSSSQDDGRRDEDVPHDESLEGSSQGGFPSSPRVLPDVFSSLSQSRRGLSGPSQDAKPMSIPADWAPMAVHTRACPLLKTEPLSLLELSRMCGLDHCPKGASPEELGPGGDSPSHPAPGRSPTPQMRRNKEGEGAANSCDSEPTELSEISETSRLQATVGMGTRQSPGVTRIASRASQEAAFESFSLGNLAKAFQLSQRGIESRDMGRVSSQDDEYETEYLDHLSTPGSTAQTTCDPLIKEEPGLESHASSSLSPCRMLKASCGALQSQEVGSGCASAPQSKGPQVCMPGRGETDVPNADPTSSLSLGQLAKVFRLSQH